MARLQVIVKPNARESRVLKQDGNCWTVAIAAPPEKGRANRELIKFFSRKLKKRVKIVSGFENRSKILEILA